MSLSSGCGKAAPRTGDFHLQTTDGNGTARDYEVIVPASYNPSTPLALTFVYHGAGGTQADSKQMGLHTATGAAAASIFVFPQGIYFHPYGIGWDDHCSGRDMVFFDRMAATLKASYCIDESNVFTAGFSWGCDQVTALACCRGSSIRAMAAASCTDEFNSAADYRTYWNSPCPSSPKMGIRFTYDPNGDGGYSAQQFASTAALYRSFNACTATGSSGTGCSSVQGCGAPFLDCRYPGMGHTLPANWANDTWSFFAGF